MVNKLKAGKLFLLSALLFVCLVRLTNQTASSSSSVTASSSPAPASSATASASVQTYSDYSSFSTKCSSITPSTNYADCTNIQMKGYNCCHTNDTNKKTMTCNPFNETDARAKENERTQGVTVNCQTVDPNKVAYTTSSTVQQANTAANLNLAANILGGDLGGILAIASYATYVSAYTYDDPNVMKTNCLQTKFAPSSEDCIKFRVKDPRTHWCCRISYRDQSKTPTCQFYTDAEAKQYTNIPKENSNVIYECSSNLIYVGIMLVLSIMTLF